jgi:hypothetical protein
MPVNQRIDSSLQEPPLCSDDNFPKPDVIAGDSTSNAPPNPGYATLSQLTASEPEDTSSLGDGYGSTGGSENIPTAYSIDNPEVGFTASLFGNIQFNPNAAPYPSLGIMPTLDVLPPSSNDVFFFLSQLSGSQLLVESSLTE